MSREITMPQLGFTMVEGTITAWLKREGEQVARGEPLMEVTTEKVSIQVEAAAEGILEKILVSAGTTVPVGTPVCLIGVEGKEPTLVGEHAVSTSAGETELTISTREEAGSTPFATPIDRSSEPLTRASGLAKRLAREHGIDLGAVKGSGPRGRILEADLIRAINNSQPSSASGQLSATSYERSAPSTQHSPSPSPRSSALSPRLNVPGRRIPFVGTRKLTADRMYQSARDTAHVTLVAEVDATEAVRLREQLLAEWERSLGVRLTFTDLIVKACGKALREHPTLNATQVEEEILLCEEVNVGVAVALEDALMVPVLRGVDAKPLQSIAVESRQLVDRARRRALTVDDVSGGTFTVTNLGSYGIDLFTPIINPPETAILGVGRIAERPAVYNGDICKRSLMYLSLTFDHRLVDGAPAALFLQRLRELLEKPYLLLT